MAGATLFMFEELPVENALYLKTAGLPDYYAAHQSPQATTSPPPMAGAMRWF
jgi:hypothetical protein